MPSLDGVDAKIRRAKHHIDDLRELVSVALDPSGHSFDFDSEKNDGKHVLRVHGVPKVDPDWSLVLGDCIHNLRSALDHLAWQLVELDGQTPTRKTMFPIWDAPFIPDPKRTKKAKILPARIKPSIRRKDISDLVERVQPYRGIDGRWVDSHESLLWALNCLSNIDKHRLPLVVTFVFDKSRLSWGWDESEGPPVKGPIHWNRAPLKDGDAVLWFTFTKGEVPEGFDPNPGLRVSIHEQEIPFLSAYSAENALSLLAFAVEDEVVHRFRPLFS